MLSVHLLIHSEPIFSLQKLHITNVKLCLFGQRCELHIVRRPGGDGDGGGGRDAEQAAAAQHVHETVPQLRTRQVCKPAALTDTLEQNALIYYS